MSNTGKKAGKNLAAESPISRMPSVIDDEYRYSPSDIALKNKRRNELKNIWDNTLDGELEQEYDRDKLIIVNGSEDPDQVARAMIEALVDYKSDFVAKDIVKVFFEKGWFAAELIEAFSAASYDLLPKSNNTVTVSTSINKSPKVSDDRSDESHGKGTASPPTLDITSEQMDTYRLVAAAISRAHRSQLTPEQAAYESKQGTKRSNAARARQTPEQRAARSKREAERLAKKRALLKAPQP